MNMYKKTKFKLLASVIAVGLTVGLAGCSAGDSEASEKEAAASTYTEFVDGLLSIDSAKADALFAELQTKYAGVETATDEQKKEVIDSFISLAPQTYALVDLGSMTLDEQGSAIAGTASYSDYFKDVDLEITVPDSAVTVNDDKATIDRSKIVVKGIEKPDADSKPTQELEPVTLVKKNDKWLLSSTLGLLSEATQ